MCAFEYDSVQACSKFCRQYKILLPWTKVEQYVCEYALDTELSAHGGFMVAENPACDMFFVCQHTPMWACFIKKKLFKVAIVWRTSAVRILFFPSRVL
jgi:hypothetical protein